MSSPSWYPDPAHRHQLRWWDGVSWTDHVSDAGVAAVDPLGDTLLPPPSPAPSAPSAPSTPSTPSTPSPAATSWAPPPAAGSTPIVVTAGPEHPGSSRRAPLIAAIVAAVLLLGAGVWWVTGRSDDTGDRTADTEETEPDETDPDEPRPDETDPDGTDPDEGDTTVPATGPATSTATTVAEASTTVATTTPPLTLPSTVAPTTPPTTQPDVTSLSEDEVQELLIAALPLDGEFPPGWTPLDGEPDTEPFLASGTGIGLCGGDTADQRASSSGMITRVWHPGHQRTPAGEVYVGVYAFPSPAEASAFLTLTVQQAATCGPGLTFQQPEGDGFGEYDGFSDIDSGPIWTITDNAGSQPAPLGGADESFQLDVRITATTRYQGVSYTTVDADVILYERRGGVVIVYDLYGQPVIEGFADVEPAWIYEPVRGDLDVAIGAARPAMITRLQQLGLVP